MLKVAPSNHEGRGQVKEIEPNFKIHEENRKDRQQMSGPGIREDPKPPQAVPPATGAVKDAINVK